jgi:hypothetical protein
LAEIFVEGAWPERSIDLEVVLGQLGSDDPLRRRVL